MKITPYIIATISIIALIFTSCKTEPAIPQQTMTYPQFYHGCNQVKAYLDQNQLDKAMEYFDRIATQVPKVPSHYYYTLAEKAAEAEQCDKAAKYLKLALENGKEYEASSGGQKIRSCEEALKEIIVMETEIHERTFNYDYKEKIDSMFVLDKAFRRAGVDEKLAAHDSLNKKLLIELYGTYGYPSELLIGSISTSNANILMLRTDPDNGDELFLPWFQEAYDKGYLNARKYAGFTDRIKSSGIDYTAPYYYEMRTHDYPLMIEVERAEIDKRRDSIGLPPKPR